MTKIYIMFGTPSLLHQVGKKTFCYAFLTKAFPPKVNHESVDFDIKN